MFVKLFCVASLWIQMVLSCQPASAPSKPCPIDRSQIEVPEGLRWVSASNGHLPQGAVPGDGWDYIGRTGHKGDLVPGKIDLYNKGLYIPSGNDEHFYRHYEALVKDSNSSLDLKWVTASGGYVPPGAVPGGWSIDTCEPFYIGVTASLFRNYNVIGKIHPTYGKFYFPSGNEEHQSTVYKVLVEDSTDSYSLSNVRYDIDDYELVSKRPYALVRMTLTNEGNSPQRASTSRAVWLSKSETWTRMNSMKIGAETEVKAGIPRLAEGKIKLSAEATFSYSWGETKTTTTIVTVDAEAMVPARSQILVTVTATKSEIHVPFTATVKKIKNGKVTDTRTKHGVFKNVEVHDHRVTYSRAMPLI